jgi:hypothetical protein
LFLPIWVQKDWDDGWSTFGGGGCELNRGGEAKDFCLAGWVLTKKILPELQLGAELVHQIPTTKGGHSSTGLGAGFTYDVTEHWHLLGYLGPGLQNTAQTSQLSWYAAVLLTF